LDYSRISSPSRRSAPTLVTSSEVPCDLTHKATAYVTPGRNFGKQVISVLG